jgi:hypothetical protein
MAHSFSPLLAHLLMAGLARRALLSTDIRADRPGADEPAAPTQAVSAAADGASPPAQPAIARDAAL